MATCSRAYAPTAAAHLIRAAHHSIVCRVSPACPRRLHYPAEHCRAAGVVVRTAASRPVTGVSSSFPSMSTACAEHSPQYIPDTPASLTPNASAPSDSTRTSLTACHGQSAPARDAALSVAQSNARSLAPSTLAALLMTEPARAHAPLGYTRARRALADPRTSPRLAIIAPASPMPACSIARELSPQPAGHLR